MHCKNKRPMGLNGQPSTRTSAPWVIKFTILLDSSLVIIPIPSSMPGCLGVEKKILEEIKHFHYIDYMVRH